MSGDNKSSKSKAGGRKGGTAAFGVAGALSLAATCICGACKASASTTIAGIAQSSNARVLLAEEEISDVSLSTFYVFDKENARMPGARFAAGGHGGGGGGGGGCGGHGGGGGGHGCGGGGGHGCGGGGCAAHGCGHGCGGGGCRGCAVGGCGGCGGGCGGCCLWIAGVRVC
jgi:hypothetical protein